MNTAIEANEGLRAGVREETMRAVVASGYGDSEVMSFTRVGIPTLAPREVLVRVRAAGLDRGTWHLMAGKPYLMRVFGFGFFRPKQPVMGRDVAGTVVAVGPQVTRFTLGDEVFGIGEGSFAEQVCVREEKLVKKPAALTFEQAAVLGISGLTALQAVEAGAVAEGKRVLIIGASGGLGSYAVQIAKLGGAHVTAVCSGAKAGWVRSLGADEVIDYRTEDFAARDERYDAIIDGGGNAPLSRLRRVLAPKAVVVFAGGEGGNALTGGIFGRPLLGALIGLFTGQRFKMLINREHFSLLEKLAGWSETGRLKPALERTVPLEQAQEAMRSMIAGEVRGKIAIVVQPADS